MAAFSINGQICDPTEATISVLDHGFLYGDGVFEGLRFYHGRVLKFTAHLDRLMESALALSLRLPMTTDQIKAAVMDTVTASGFSDGYVRLIVTRGIGALGIDPRNCTEGQVIVIVDQLTMVSDTVRSQGARLIIASNRRLAADQLDARIKSLNYLNQILARIEANNANADEAVVLNQNGFVAEGTADNIFIMQRGVLCTPPATDGALEGITRGLVLKLAEELHIPTSICSLTPFDLYTADECFLTGTGAELIPVREISGREIKSVPGTIYQRISAAFQAALKQDEVFL